MKKLQRVSCLLLSVLLLTSVFSGCGKQDEQPAETFTLNVSTCGALSTLDPALVSGVGEESLLSTLFEGLMRMRDDGTGKAEAVWGVAKEYTEEKNYDDTVTYTFTIRSSARWSDGKRVKAEDFVYAWQRLVDPALDSPNASLLSVVQGYDTVRESGDVTALNVKAKGDSTLIVTLSKPCAYFISSICTAPAAAPLRRDLVEGSESWAATADIVTNGAYRVNSWVKDSYLQTARNEEYYEARLVVPDALRFTFSTDASANYDALNAGELDYISQLPYAAIETMAENEDWRPAPLAETYCVVYNDLTDTFSDPVLRKAFEMAIDRAALAEKAGVTATVATGCVPTGVSNTPESEEDFRATGGALCPADTEGYAERSAEASRTIAAAGHYQGAGLDKLRYVYVEGEQNRTVALALRDMWKSVLGIDVELIAAGAEEYEELLAAGDFDLAGVTLTSRCDDAMSYLLPFRGTSESNVSGYRNDTFDLLIGVAESTDDLTARAAFLHDAEAMLLEDYALSPLYFCGTAYALRESYQGVSHDCFGHAYFTAVNDAGATERTN